MTAIQCRRRTAAGWSDWLDHTDLRVPGDVALIAANEHDAGARHGEMRRWGVEWEWRCTPAEDLP